MKPLVSLIVRTIDRPYYLKECLQSIAIQTYPNIEVIIINDGGPSVREFVASLSLPIKYSVTEFSDNWGRSHAGNEGLKKARGTYIGFIDDDDIFYPFHVETLVDALENSNYKVAYSDSLSASQIKCSYFERIYTTIASHLVHSEDFSRPELLKRNYIPILTVLFHRDCLGSGLQFDTKLEVLEDWDFWISLSEDYDFLHVKQITSEYRYRVDGSNTVGQLDSMWNWSRAYIADKHSRAIRKLIKEERGSIGL